MNRRAAHALSRAIPILLACVLVTCGGSGGGGGGGQNPSPETTITSSPSGLTNLTNATFAFASDDANATFEISVDGGHFANATSPFQVSNVSDGQHTFAVRARNAAGTIDPTPASFSWTVDTLAPDTTLTSTPALLGNSVSASFQFTSSKANSSFEVSIDGGAFAAQTSPVNLSSLAGGSHTFSVRARDAAGNIDPTPASFTWNVDILPPDTALISTPTLFSNSVSASFHFTSSEPNSSFEVSIDGGAFSPQANPANFAGLADGSHTFAVRARDAAGNLDPTPASFSWTVDTLPPDTTLTSTPPSLSNSANASFHFASSEPNSSFQVSIDSGAFAPGVSPVNLAGLTEGSHTLQVRAIDLATNVDPTPASFAWTVDLTAPTAKIVFPTPVSYTDASQLMMRGSAADANGISSVTVNGVAATTTDGFATWRATVPIAPGQNTLSVSVTDRAGNTRTDADSVQVRNDGVPIRFVASMDMDAAQNRILIADVGALAVLAADRTTARVSFLSDAAHGSGPGFQTIDSLIVDTTNNRALVVDGDQNALIAVNLSNGDRTVLSSVSNSTAATSLFLGNGITFDAANNAAFVATNGIGGSLSVIRVDLATGTRTVTSCGVPSQQVGTGDAFGDPRDIVYDNVTNPAIPRLLVSDAQQQRIVAVETVTGNRTTLSAGGIGTNLVKPNRMKLDPANGRLLVVDSDDNRNALVAVDLATGNRTTLADSVTGSGPAPGFAGAVAFSAALDVVANRAFVSAFTGGEIIAVDLVTLGRSFFSNSNVGNRSLVTVDGVSVNPNTDSSLLVLDGTQKFLFNLELATAALTEVSGPSVGGGTAFTLPAMMALDSASSRVLVIDFTFPSAVILGVDLASGNRSLISSAFIGRGMAYDSVNNRVLQTNSFGVLAAIDLATGNPSSLSSFSVPIGVAFDNVSNPGTPRALVVDFSSRSLIAVDLGNGSSTTLSGGFVGTGPGFLGPKGVAVDGAKRRALVTDTTRLIAVDLATGNRSLLSGPDTGTTVVGGGVAFFDPNALDVDSTSGIAFVVANGYRAVMAVDVTTGERVIVAR